LAGPRHCRGKLLFSSSLLLRKRVDEGTWKYSWEIKLLKYLFYWKENGNSCICIPSYDIYRDGLSRRQGSVGLMEAVLA